MKSMLTVTALLSLLGSSSAFAANLNIPMAFEFLAVNGQKIESSVFSHKSDLALENGSHKIAIRYSEMVEDDFTDSQSFIKSAPFIVTLMVDGDHEYRLSAAEGNVVKKPKQYAKAPQVVITRQDKGNVSYQVVQTDFEEESFVSRLFSGNQAQDVDAIAAAATGAAVAHSVTQPSAPISKPNPVAATAQTQPIKSEGQHAEQMLQYWWLQADEKTRKEFMSWAIKQL